MFNEGRGIARSLFRYHFADGKGCGAADSPSPCDGKKAIAPAGDCFRRLEGYLQTRFHLHVCIGERLEFTSVLMMHVRHEDGKVVFRQFAKHLLHFRKMNRILGIFQRWRQYKAASLSS